MYKAILSAFVIVAMPLARQVDAHHSAVMFDERKSTTLAGTVKAFQWTNPHCWIQVLIPENPEPQEWSVELGSPAQLYNKGWKPKTLKPGDQIIVVIHPLRDGTNGGVFVSATDNLGHPLVPAALGVSP